MKRSLRFKIKMWEISDVLRTGKYDYFRAVTTCKLGRHSKTLQSKMYCKICKHCSAVVVYY